MNKLTIIQNKIYEVRDQKVMLDFDLALLYKVETRALNQAVKRNAKRFPKDFVFRLTAKEWKDLLAQNNSSQTVMSSHKHRGSIYLPYAFTEHGVTMLASILNSDRAVKMNLVIVRAFIALKQLVTRYNGLEEQLIELRDRLGEHDTQLNAIYDAIENLLEEKTEQKNWEERERIGFKK